MSESENSDVRNDEAASVGPNGVRLITNPAYKRIREHAEAFRRIGSNGRPLGRYGKIFDFLITAKIPADEKWLMICLCLIGDRKNPTKKELAKTAKMSPQNVSELLNSLQVRGMVVFDFLSTDPLNEKVLIHITDPYYWKGVFQSYNIPHNPIIKPHLWESRVLACLDSRINDAHAYSEEDYGYVEAPRLLLDLDIPYRAKLLWLYLASLCTFEHPTESEIAFALDIKSDSARKYLQLLRAKQMICSEDFRFQKTRLLRIHHTVDVGLWRFLIARKSYGWCHIDSIIYTKEVVKDFNCPALRFAKYSVISTDPKREPRRLLNDINRPQMGTSQTPNGNLADPKREPREGVRKPGPFCYPGCKNCR
ncbi:MAG TPA: helix-turn-helix domain-containing protein [Oligoflexus sp.]|uniref:MarR family transcriptional regulator n=1 Tax=Oligoflexus sp. TaxID=1971216 RepID=UPI002D80432B|nr:helix-turn-helix domain-containing protein [Oligoflexus sp.]HET9239182.1 helix-turn-helix domain-containing protein [Oligoflexus sp.]